MMKKSRELLGSLAYILVMFGGIVFAVWAASKL